MLKRVVVLLLLGAGVVAGLPTRANADARCLVLSGVDQVRCLVLAGEIMPFEPIFKKIVSQVRGDYIGADFDVGTRTYRFRFLVDGNVINVDVDARTGQRVQTRRNY